MWFVDFLLRSSPYTDRHFRLIDGLREMTEASIRRLPEGWSEGLTEILKEEDSAEGQYQCRVCSHAKTFCYLSQVVYQCISCVACADHIDLLCENRPSHKIVLRKRFTDEELQETLSCAAERAKLHKLLMESARPSLRPLPALLAEGDRFNYPLPSPEMSTSTNVSREPTNASTSPTLSSSASKAGKGRLASLVVPPVRLLRTPTTVRTGGSKSCTHTFAKLRSLGSTARRSPL